MTEECEGALTCRRRLGAATIRRFRSVHCRLPLLDDLFGKIGYSLRLMSPELSNSKSNLAFLWVIWRSGKGNGDVEMVNK